jgi:hypothetical protein
MKYFTIGDEIKSMTTSKTGTIIDIKDRKPIDESLHMCKQEYLCRMYDGTDELLFKFELMESPKNEKIIGTTRIILL